MLLNWLNLFILLFSNIYIFCACSILKVETHNNLSTPGQEKLDLIHNNIIGPFSISINRVRYMVFFINHDTKKFKVSFLK